MVKGLPKSIIKKYGISKKAWQVYRGRKSSRSSNPRPTKRARKVKKLARRKYRRRSDGMTIPLAPIAGLVAGLGEPIDRALQGNFTGPNSALSWLTLNYTGYNDQTGNWNIMAAKGLPPLIIGALVHKFVGGSPLNINRMLARAKVPFIRI